MDRSLCQRPCLLLTTMVSAYVYFHGGSDYLVTEMADDMLSIMGDFTNGYGRPSKMEGPGVQTKRIYYFTMPENNRTLSYYTGESPKGPWKYQGVIMQSEGGNNHHSIVEFKGQDLVLPPLATQQQFNL
ncbi:MAG: hypothetical protein H6569_05990 [Lewinellaceae bacterium]|nr:hypothetical protein [Lewinellaceae bacterium]